MYASKIHAPKLASVTGGALLRATMLVASCLGSCAQDDLGPSEEGGPEGRPPALARDDNGFAPGSLDGLSELDRQGVRVFAPYDGQWFDGGHFSFYGEGYSNWQIQPQLRNRENGEWANIADQVSEFVWEGFSDSPARQDPGGIAWFRWHAEANWPYFSPTWAGPIVTNDDQQRAAPIEIRFVNPAEGGHVFAHFRQDSQQCIENAEQGGIEAVAEQCQVDKGSVTYFFKCGRQDQACCAGADQPCDGSLVCTDTKCRARPEPQPEPPPPSGPSCGEVGQSCCEHSKCNNPQSACGGGKCEPPGDWWHYTCACQDATGAAAFDTHACFPSGVSNPGFNWVCGLIAAQLQDASGLSTSCGVYSTIGKEGTCLDVPGNWSAAPVR